MDCLLCSHPSTSFFSVLNKPERDYFHCKICDLIFMKPEQRLSQSDEKARYDLHQNEKSQGYLDFLLPLVIDIDRLVKSSQKNCPGPITCLDYGSGPTAFLSSQFFERGYLTYNYDLYYYPDTELFRQTYDVVTSTETWEHFYNPKEEIKRQVDLLKKGGYLGIMTLAHQGEFAFHSWHYRRDMTHVSFFSDKTMTWIANQFNLKILRARSPYWIFQKN